MFNRPESSGDPPCRLELGRVALAVIDRKGMAREAFAPRPG
jgi:hypothetical protein